MTASHNISYTTSGAELYFKVVCILWSLDRGTIEIAQQQLNVTSLTHDISCQAPFGFFPVICLNSNTIYFILHTHMTTTMSRTLVIRNRSRGI